jgi:thiol-disulfide isomerase/thioredoxin
MLVKACKFALKFERAMKKVFFMFSVLLFSLAAAAQQIPAYSADDVIHHTSSKDTVYIINFWATWCVPCVQELPEFNALQQRYAGRPVKILLVSLDFKEDVPAKLNVFLKRKKITPQVAWLSDTDPNVFIPKIENSWGGSIPATIVVAPGKNFKKFIEGQITEEEISKIADKQLEK